MEQKKKTANIENLLRAGPKVERPSTEAAQRANDIVRYIQRQENFASLMNFGIVRFWTVLLEIFAFLYTRSQHLNKAAQPVSSLQR